MVICSLVSPSYDPHFIHIYNYAYIYSIQQHADSFELSTPEISIIVQKINILNNLIIWAT